MLGVTQAWALDVECTPGSLSSQLIDKNITELKITGTLDARDFKFIADELDALTSVDLSGAAIAAYDCTTPLFASDIHYPANTIPAMAFFGKPLTTVTLAQDTKAIGMAAFAGCKQLTEIDLPEGLDSIAAYAFSSSALGHINLPGTIKTMGIGVFAHCTSLLTATVNPAAAMALPKDTFLDCLFLNVLSLGQNVVAIEDGALAGAERLTSITFIDGNNISHIGTAAFIGSGITNFNFEQSTTLNHIGDWAFATSKQVSATMPASVNHVGKGAFYYAKDLNSYVPNGTLTKIDDYTLAGTAVTNDNAAGTVTDTIGAYAFYNTPATTLTLPATLKYIGTQAMAGMTQMQSLTSEAETVPALGDDVWAGVNQAVIPLYVPNSSFDAYNEAMQWQNFMVTKKWAIVGDVNQDGYVNSADVTALYSFILHNNMQFYETSDVNQDGSINAADVTAVYRIILGSSNAPRHPSYRPTTDALNASDFSINAGETYKLEVNLHNSTPYTAMQLDIDLPQGLSIVAVRHSNRAKESNLGYAEVAPGKWRILSTTASTNAWTGSDGTIFTIEIKADESFGGNENINFNSIIAVEPNEETHIMNELNVGVSTPTGVKDINIDDIDNGPVDVYNMNGQLLRRGVDRNEATQGLPAGIYIVGGKKVMVK